VPILLDGGVALGVVGGHVVGDDDELIVLVVS
jgi:hypothetical protein